MEHELPNVLDGIDEPVTVEELEGVVRRAGQRRRARLVAGAAALLAVGAVGGAVARGPGDAGTPGGYAGRSTPSTLPAAVQGDTESSSGFAMGGGTGQTLTPLFRREANGVAIRAYRASWTVPDGKETSPCAPPELISGQLSNGAAVTVAMAPFPATKASAEPEPPLRVLAVGSFGREEGEESSWVVARVAAPVVTVRVTVGGTIDTMEPQGGVALLAVPGDGMAPFPLVEGLSADGAVVATDKAVEPEMSQMPVDPACFPQSCASGGSGGGAAGEPTSEEPDAKKREDVQKAIDLKREMIRRSGGSEQEVRAVEDQIHDGPFCQALEIPPPPVDQQGGAPGAEPAFPIPGPRPTAAPYRPATTAVAGSTPPSTAPATVPATTSTTTANPAP